MCVSVGVCWSQVVCVLLSVATRRTHNECRLGFTASHQLQNWVQIECRNQAAGLTLEGKLDPSSESEPAKPHALCQPPTVCAHWLTASGVLLLIVWAVSSFVCRVQLD